MASVNTVATASTSPSQLTAADGQLLMETKLRSVLISRSSYECFDCCNKEAPSRAEKYPVIYLEWKKEVEAMTTAFWTAWRKSKKTKESDFTTLFTAYVAKLLEPQKLECKCEGTVKTPASGSTETETSGRVDIYIYQPSPSNVDNILSALFEFGIDKEQGRDKKKEMQQR
jgi:hypothetical protein